MIDTLHSSGHALYKISGYHRGVVDSIVLSIARQRREVLITKDTDFGKLIFIDGLPTAGVLLVRLPNAMSPLEQAQRVSNVISIYGNALIGAFTVLDSDNVRLRLV
jgi:predicted nuclease of predicted toxin-antitoxin system